MQNLSKLYIEKYSINPRVNKNNNQIKSFTNQFQSWILKIFYFMELLQPAFSNFQPIQMKFVIFLLMPMYKKTYLSYDDRIILHTAA